jgi:hypothetical protein
MKRIKLVVLVFLGCAVSMMAHHVAVANDAVPPPASAAVVQVPAREVEIHFASQNIWRWRAVDYTTVLIQDRGRRWYKATLYGYCVDLPFAQNLSFVSNPSGSFDRFSSIIVREQRCPLRSLVQTTAPPKKLAPPDPAAAPKTPTTASPALP